MIRVPLPSALGAVVLLARRNLFRDRVRFLLSVFGVAVPTLLIVLVSGYREGIYRQASAYLDNTPGSIVVMGWGARGFLGTASTLSPASVAAVRSTPGVGGVIALASQFVVFERHDRKDGFFLIGYEPETGGGPWRLVDGREPAADDELVVDRTMASGHDLRLGDELGVLDRSMTVVGLSEGTTFWAGSIAFAPVTTLESLLRAPGQRSLLLLTPSADVAPEQLIARLSAAGSSEARVKDEVVEADRRLLARVYDAPVALMVAIAFLVGVLVVGLVIYTATVERRREYGVLKAVGAGNAALYRIVGLQALIAATAGTAIGLVLAGMMSAGLVLLRPQFPIAIDTGTVTAVLASGTLMALLSALIPIRSVARVEPAEVFRA
jgi:putative ABC transport system permease protein